VSDRLDELAVRRRMLLLRSERLRADLAADQQVFLDALSGVDRALATAKRAAKPVLLVGAGLLLLRLIRGGGRRRAVATAAAAGASGLAMRALFWITTAQKALPYISLIRNLWRSRSSRGHGGYASYADAGTETEHLY
jgi:hypothetical protein